MLVAAAFVPIPPLLVPEIAGGSASVDQGLRQACRAVAARLLAAGPEHVVVVGPAVTGGPADGSWDWRGFGVAAPDQAPARSLPLGLAIGDWLLDTHDGPTPSRSHHGIAPTTEAADCAGLGRKLVAGPRPTGLLVCGDGTACRTEKAPGSFDPAAEVWDAAALAALRDAHVPGLMALDAAAGRRLMAAGRAPWQVLAGAADGTPFDARIDWADAPYGVTYIAGTWCHPQR